MADELLLNADDQLLLSLEMQEKALRAQQLKALTEAASVKKQPLDIGEAIARLLGAAIPAALGGAMGGGAALAGGAQGGLSFLQTKAEEDEERVAQDKTLKTLIAQNLSKDISAVQKRTASLTDAPIIAKAKSDATFKNDIAKRLAGKPNINLTNVDLPNAVIDEAASFTAGIKHGEKMIGEWEKFVQESDKKGPGWGEKIFGKAGRGAEFNTAAKLDPNSIQARLVREAKLFARTMGKGFENDRFSDEDARFFIDILGPSGFITTPETIIERMRSATATAKLVRDANIETFSRIKSTIDGSQMVDFPSVIDNGSMTDRQRLDFLKEKRGIK